MLGRFLGPGGFDVGQHRQNLVVGQHGGILGHIGLVAGAGVFLEPVFGDVDEGLANAAATQCRGVSLEYGVEELNAEVVDLVHNKGYGLVIWVVNEPDDIQLVWNSKPDFIETDNADFKDFIDK